MSNPTNQKYKYQVGGTLRINRSVFYVERQADNLLFDSIKSGEFCYVLNSRQMGKSSLALNTIKRLQAEESGFACVIIDISILGSQQVSLEQWYLGFADYLIEELKLDEKINLSQWWQQQESLSPVRKLDKLLRKVILVETKKPIAIFIDEIDKILDLNFKSDDFFGLIRSFYNEKANNPAFEKLSFILLGVARPEELIKEYQITPFNIGKAIDLSGFSVEESLPLAAGLTDAVDNPHQVIEEIISWTGGQPFLTQKICQLILDRPKKNKAESDRDFVKRLVEDHIVNNWEANDDPVHLKTIKGRLLHDRHTTRLLGLYQQILENGAIAANDLVEQIELRLSGLVVREGNWLKPYNRIYTSVFDLDWIDSILDMERPYAEYIHAWKESKYDKKWLLREEKLAEALSWSKGKSLSDFDYQYLNASRDLKLKEASAQITLQKETYLLRGIVAVLLVGCAASIGMYVSGYRHCPEDQRIDDVCFDFDISNGNKNIFGYPPDSIIDLGIEAFKKEQYKDAKAYFDKAAELRPSDPVPKIYSSNAKVAKANEAGKQTFKLAVVVPFNTSEDYSRMILRGVADAQTEFNDSGGKNGQLLEIVIANDDSNKDLAEDVATKLISKNEILGVIGHSSSKASEAAKKKYEPKNLAMISPAATSNELTELTEENNQVFFRTVPADDRAAKKLVDYIAEKKHEPVIVFYDEEDSSSKSLKDAFVKEYKNHNRNLSDKQIKNLNDFKIENVEDLEDDETKKFFQNSNLYKAAVILTSINSRSIAVDVIHEIYEKNKSLPEKFQIKEILGNDVMYSSGFLQEASFSAEGMIIAVTWSKDTCYGKEAKKKWQVAINWRTAASYDATQAFIQAIEDTDNPDRQKILNTLRSYDRKNPITNTSEDNINIWFGDKGNSNRQSRLVEVIRDERTPTTSGSEFGFRELEPDKAKKCSQSPF